MRSWWRSKHSGLKPSFAATGAIRQSSPLVIEQYARSIGCNARFRRAQLACQDRQLRQNTACNLARFECIRPTSVGSVAIKIGNGYLVRIIHLAGDRFNAAVLAVMIKAQLFLLISWIRTVFGRIQVAWMLSQPKAMQC